MNASSRPTGTVKYDFTGCVVVVTGGGQGIGLAIVNGFAAAGATVVCLERNLALASSMPSGVLFLELDVSDPEACKRAVAQVIAQFSRIDVLVNNAGIQPKWSYLGAHAMDADQWRTIIETNLGGYQYMAAPIISQMIQQGGGVIVNIASAQAHRTARDVPAYGVSKAGNLLQTKQWGVQYARNGIRVVSISPGAIRTPMVLATLGEQGGEAQLANRHPLGRLGEPAEIANGVLWAASDGASFVTAADIEIDGGLGAFGAFADGYPMPSPQ